MRVSPFAASGPWMLLLLVVALAGAAGAQEALREETLWVDQRIVLDRDGRLTVTQRARVRTRARAAPTLRCGRLQAIRWTRWGLPVPVDVAVLSASLDGRAVRGEAVRGTRYQDAHRLSLKPAAQAVSAGEHDVSLTYRVTGLMDGSGRLRWRVHGRRHHGAPLVGRYRVVVVVPGAHAARLSAVVGGRTVAGAVGADGHALLEAEGLGTERDDVFLTIRWPPGVEVEPVGLVRALAHNRHIPWLAAGALALLILMAVARRQVGASRPTALPRPEPPSISPAAARYVDRMAYDRQCLEVTLLHLAAAGRVAFEETDGRLRLVPGAGGGPLAPEERAVHEALFDGVAAVPLSPDGERAQVLAAGSALQTRLEASYADLLDVAPGWGRVISRLGVATIVVGALLGMTTTSGDKAFLIPFLTLWTTIWTGATLALVAATLVCWWNALRGGGGLAVSLGLSVVSVPFVMGEVFGMTKLCEAASPWYPPLVLLIAALALLAARLRGRTPEGQQLQEDIEGYRSYLAEQPSSDGSLARVQARAAFEAALGLPAPAAARVRQALPRVGPTARGWGERAASSVNDPASALTRRPDGRR